MYKNIFYMYMPKDDEKRGDSKPIFIKSCYIFKKYDYQFQTEKTLFL